MVAVLEVEWKPAEYFVEGGDVMLVLLLTSQQRGVDEGQTIVNKKGRVLGSSPESATNALGGYNWYISIVTVKNGYHANTMYTLQRHPYFKLEMDTIFISEPVYNEGQVLFC